MAELASRRFILQEALVWCHTHSKCSRNVSDYSSMSCQCSTTYPAPSCRRFPSIVPSSPPYNILSLILRICKVKHSLQCPCVLELSCSDSYPCLSNQSLRSRCICKNHCLRVEALVWSGERNKLWNNLGKGSNKQLTFSMWAPEIYLTSLIFILFCIFERIKF